MGQTKQRAGRAKRVPGGMEKVVAHVSHAEKAAVRALAEEGHESESAWAARAIRKALEAAKS